MKCIFVERPTLPMAWERAVTELWNYGDLFPTHYDRPGDPPSKEVMAVIHVTEPMAEPRIHRSFCGGPADLEKYRAEVVDGVHDYWTDPVYECSVCGVRQLDRHEGCVVHPEASLRRVVREDYTYHSRFADHIDQVVNMLRADPTSRRCKLNIWQSPSDLTLPHAPCLQYLWFRSAMTPTGPVLHMTAHIRSNDAWKAAFMNMHAFTELQAHVASQLGWPVGEYVHVADSFHIYGQDWPKFEGFLRLTTTRPVDEDRTFRTNDLLPQFIEGCDELLAEPDMPEAKKTIIQIRRTQLLDQIVQFGTGVFG
jgi:thymidylate synthase